MSVSIVIAWKEMGCPHRRAAFDFVTCFWRRYLPEAELVVESGPEPFSRSGALNAAIEKATGDVLFEVGPDSIAIPSSVREALELAGEADGLVVCHSRWVHLAEGQTRELLALGPYRCEEFVFDVDAADEWGMNSVDLTAFSRRTWEQAGGYDERFGVWGGDDGAFALACGTLVAEQRRVAGDWIHLWHPRLPQSIPGNPGYAEQFALLREYIDASEKGRDAMLELVRNR